MKTIEKIITANGGMKALRNTERLRVVNSAGTALVIKYLGRGPNGGNNVSVSQYEPEGPLVASMRFETDKYGWLPGYFFDGISRKEMFVFAVRGPDGNPLIGINLELQRTLEELAQKWDKKLKKQGFFETDEQDQYYPLFTDEQLAV